MAIKYNKTTWRNDETPLNQSNLNKIEDGIEANSKALSEHEASLVILDSAIKDTQIDVAALFAKLHSNTSLKFFCVEPVMIKINGEISIYPENSNVDITLAEEDVLEIQPTSNNSILSLSAFPGALCVFYPWLEGVKQFSNILFNMNPEDMYTKWSQGQQGSYQVQYAQYLNCIFWSDNPYISEVTKRTNYTLYYSSQLPLCYSNIPDNTFKSFYLAFNVNSDPNWGNKAYRDSFAKANWATQVFSYYGARTIGIFGHDDPDFNIVLPKDCRGLMSAATAIENAGTFDAINTTNFGAKSGSWRDAFGWCSSLRNLYIKNLKVNLNVSWSPLEYDSIYFIISTAANTNKITISVSPYTYNLLGTSDFELAKSKNITIELIKTNYYEDRRVSAITITGDGTKVLTNDGTYKLLPTKTSDLTNDSGFADANKITELEEAIPTLVSQLKNDANYATKDEVFVGDYNSLINKPDIYTKSETDSKLTKDNLISIIGKASQTLDGVMSKEDKQKLDALTALLEDDDNDIVDKINEVIAIFNQYPEGATIIEALAGKQDKLVSGTNLKTINNQSLLGEGNIEIEAGETLIENDSLTTVAIGGIAKGVSLKNKSVVEVIESIFFPYVAFSMGNMSSSPGATTVVEKGTAKTVNSITQPITLGSKSLTSLKLYKGSTLLQEKTSGITSSNSFTNLAQSLTATTTFKVEATDGTTSLNKTLNVFTFVDPYFYGILSTNSTPSSSDITSKTKAVASKGNKTYSFTCTGAFPFIAYPASYGDLKSILDGNGFENLTDFTKHTVTLAVTSGNVSYNIYIKNSAATVTSFAYTFKY